MTQTNDNQGLGGALRKRGRPEGSGGNTKSDQIRELLRTGMSGADIAKQVGCSINLVYNVKSKMLKAGGGGVATTASRTKDSALKSGDLGAFLNSVRALEKERDELRDMLRTIADKIAPLIA